MKLKDIVKSKITALERSERSTDGYGQAAWPYMQADSNGSIRALKNILTLLDFVKDTKDGK